MSNFQNLMSVQKFAEQMNKNIPIGLNKIYALVKEPGFPSVKIHGRYLILADKVDEWLEQQNYKKGSNNNV